MCHVLTVCYAMFSPYQEEPLLPSYPVVTFRRDMEDQSNPASSDGCARAYPGYNVFLFYLLVFILLTNNYFLGISWVLIYS